MAKQRYQGHDADLVREIHSYIDVAFGLIDNDANVQVAAGSRLSPTTIHNLRRHEGQYCPSSLTLAKLAEYSGLQLLVAKGTARVKMTRRRAKAA